MAINDVSLTAGMRSNLLSLQNTVNLLDRTQNRLSSGKKVNTAIDNPVSFFASQALTSRASVIDGLKDAMGQAVQTITAADKGITAISAMIEQAKGIAQSALSAEAGTMVGATPAIPAIPAVLGADSTATIDITDLAIGNTISIGETTYTMVAEGGFVADAGNFHDRDTLMAEINHTADYAATAVAGEATQILLTSTTETIVVGAGASLVGTIAPFQAAAAEVPPVPANPGVYTPSAELTSLQTQYNTLLAQLTGLAEDSGYKGKNLLSATESLTQMTVVFEGTDLAVEGFNATAGGLLLSEATAGTTIWSGQGAAGATAIGVSIEQLDDALVNLRSQSSKLSGNLSIISVRQDFSTNMINTLTAGSDKLTLADANEEGANMLMLQTRQSLSTTALSMSAQAAQSVLRLFQ